MSIAQPRALYNRGRCTIASDARSRVPLRGFGQLKKLSSQMERAAFIILCKIIRSGFVHFSDGFGDIVGIFGDLFVDHGRLLGENAHLFGYNAEPCACGADPGGLNGCV